jgi:hypothetical protein
VFVQRGDLKNMSGRVEVSFGPSPHVPDVLPCSYSLANQTLRLKVIIDGSVHELEGVKMEVVPRSYNRLKAQDFQPVPPSSGASPKISPNTKNSTSSGNSLDYLLRQKKSRHPVSRREKNSVSSGRTSRGRIQPGPYP